MRRDTEGAVLLAVAAVTFNLAFSGAFQSYVRTGLRIPLLVCAALLAVVGASAVFTKHGDADDEALLDHDHVHGDVVGRVGFALMVPVVAVFLIAPAPLGGFAAERGEQNRTVSGAVASGLDPLPAPVDGVVEASLREFLLRAYHEPAQVEDVTLRLVGFVVADETISDGYLLTRFTFSCCAADALPLQVAVSGVDSVPAPEQWMAVDGVWSGELIEIEDGVPIPLLDVVSQAPTAQPAQPYDY